MAKKPTYEELEQRIQGFETAELERGRAAEELKKIRNIINESPAVAFLWKNDEGWPVEFVSDNVKAIFGYKAEEFMSGGVSYAELIHPDDLERVAGEVANFSKEKKRVKFYHQPYRIVAKDGKLKWLDDLTFIQRNEKGVITHYQGIVLDITKRMQMEIALRESEEKYRTIVDNSPTGIISTDTEGNILSINSKALEIYGSPSEAATKKAINVYQYEPLKKMGVTAALKECIEKNRLTTIENYYTSKWGKKAFIHYKLSPLHDAEGKVIGAMANLIDITDRKRAEEALQESEEKYRNIFENAVEGFIQSTPAGRFISVNPAFSKMLGYASPEELISTISDIATQFYVNPEDRKRYQQLLLETGSVEQFEVKVRCKNGSHIWVSTSTRAVFDQNGEIAYYEGNVNDITERKYAETALRESEERYRLLANNVTDVIWTRDMDLLLTYISPSIIKQQGYTVEDAMDMTLEENLPPDSLKLVSDAIMEELEVEKKERKDISRSRTLEIEQICKDGSTIWTESKMTFLRDQNNNPTGIIGITRDITRRKQIEDSLRMEREQLSIILDGNPISIFMIDQNYRVVFWNRAFEALSMIPREQVMGKTLSDSLSQVYPKGTPPILVDLILEMSDEDLINRYGSVIKRADFGESFEATTSIWPGGKKRILSIIATRIRDHQGKVVGAIQCAQDITENKRLQDQLLNIQKMESLDTLASGIAHDFNNLLMGIQGRASLLLLDIDSYHSHYEHLKGIEDYVKSAADLTKQLLAFARGGKYEVKPTDLNELLHKSSEMFGRTKKEVTIHRKSQEEIWTVDVDQSQIEQVLLNMYVNAWQSMPNGGKLFLSTENVMLDADYVKPYSIEPGKYVKVSVTDTGVGIDKATQDRIFDPFFTTKEMGRGTGLGLASAYGIVKNHNGIIQVYSEEGEGTTFNIYLPVSGKEIAKERTQHEKILKGSGKILMVDDEEIIIDVGRGIIEKLGYKVLAAKSGKDAVAIYEKNQGMIDLVILDMIMPGMGGRETYEKLKKINPGIKVLLSSGYSISGQATEILDKGCNGFIQKPFNIADLSKKIRAILDKE